MKGANLLLCLSLASLVGASIYRVAYSASAPKGAPRDMSQLFRIRNVLKREYSASARLDPADARPGQVVFRLEEGVTFRGLAAAHMCPRDEHDGPSFLAAQSVVAMQTGDGLLLGSWVAERAPLEQGAHWFLCFAVWLDTPDGPEWRTGWAEVGIHDLIGTGVAVHPRRNAAVRVEVTTVNGKPAPGAMVSVDDARYAPGRFYQYAYTGEDGAVTVSGLDEDRDWRFALPSGLGPDQSPVELVVKAPVKGTVALVSPLEGDWTYQRHSLLPPMRGGSFHVEFLRSSARRPAALWSTAPWIGPGRGPWCPFYVMSRSDVTLPETVRLGLRGYTATDLPTRAEARIRCVQASAEQR